jgi:predicted NAD/FAD-binding protein
MPRRLAAWASWNYLRAEAPQADAGVCVTYWMNLLQGIDAAKPLFVTLNPPQPPRADLTFAAFDYAHPQFDAAAVDAQQRLRGGQARNGVSFAGAWLGYGFHEDGLTSGLAAAARLGAAPPWATLKAAPRAAAASALSATAAS